MTETVQQYIARILGNVEGKDPLRVQRETAGKLAKAIRGLNRRQLSCRPAPGKWSIAEILAHLADAEIVGSWRMRAILGANGTAIQAYDQDAWANAFQYVKREPRKSLETFRVLRENNLSMLKSLSKDLWGNYGLHQERGKETIAQIVRMFAGHDVNHLKQVEALAKESRR